MSMPRGVPHWPKWEGIGTLWEKPMMAVMWKQSAVHPEIIMNALHAVHLPAYRTQLGGIGYVLHPRQSWQSRRKWLTIYEYDEETETQWYVTRVTDLYDVELNDAKKHFESYLMEQLL